MRTIAKFSCSQQSDEVFGAQELKNYLSERAISFEIALKDDNETSDQETVKEQRAAAPDAGTTLKEKRLLRLSCARAVATVLIVLFHAQGIAKQRGWGNWFTEVFRANGYAPVEFFFVLSGFIIVYSHYRDTGKPDRMRGYLLRRFARIFPTYWCLCLVLVPACLLLPSWVTTQGKQSLSGIMLSLLLLPHPGVPLLGVTWTLSYELLFYSFFSLFLIRRSLGKTVFVGWAIGIIYWNVRGYENGPLAFLFSIHNAAFILGSAVALLMRLGLMLEANAARARLFLITGACLFASTLLFNVFVRHFAPASVRELFFYALGCAALTAGLSLLDKQKGIQIPVFIETLANASYSIYLCHYPALVLGAKWAEAARIPGVLVFPLLSAGGIAAGIIVFRYVEDPLLKLCLRFGQHRAAAHQPSAERLPATAVFPPAAKERSTQWA